MPTHAGPNTSADSSIVFSYDVGDVKNSYRGEPTTNYISDADTMSSWTNYYRTLASSTFTTEFGTTGYCFVKQPSWNGIYKIFNLPSTGTYTFSALFKYIEGSANNNGATVYIYNYGGGDTAVTLNKSLVGVWQRVSHTINVTSLTNVHMFLISYGGVDSGTINPDYSSWEVTMPQVELNSHPTQFVNGTRSVTQGLLPLIGNSTINLSNVSFNSAAQITYDGTDDRIDLGNLGTIGATYSIECVFNSSAVTSYRNVFDMNYETYSGVTGNVGPRLEQTTGAGINVLWSGVTNSNDSYNATNTFAISANTNYHVVFVQNGSSGAMYVNGVLRSQVNNTNGYVQTFGDANLGRGFSLAGDRYFLGSLPLFKIYNQALSADQVKQNYNQYKSRFNLS